jgi:protein involved in polysaccharide export with SLBB domain
VLGHVRSPGLYQHHIGDTVVDMLAAAGGAALVRSSDNFHTVRGDRVKVLLFREGDGENEALTLNLNDFYRRGDHSANPEVEPGDVIFVPGDRDLDVESIVRDILILPRAFSSAFED